MHAQNKALSHHSTTITKHVWRYEMAQGNPIGSRNSNLQDSISLLVGKGMILLDMGSSIYFS